jgi:hypothetical protein
MLKQLLALVALALPCCAAPRDSYTVAADGRAWTLLHGRTRQEVVERAHRLRPEGFVEDQRLEGKRTALVSCLGAPSVPPNPY